MTQSIAWCGKGKDSVPLIKNLMWELREVLEGHDIEDLKGIGLKV